MTHQTRWTLGLVALAIAARLVAALALGASFYFVDEAIYLDAARRLLAGAGFGAEYANVPGYPVVLAVLALPWPGHLVLVRCAQAIVAGAGCALLVALGSAMLGRRPALVAALLYALDPLLVVSAGLLYPETLAAVALVATLNVLWVASRDDRLPASAAAGLGLAFVILLRTVAVVLLPVLALWLAATVATRHPRRALHVLMFGACCLVALAPWAVRNYRVHGQVVPAATTGLQGAPVARTEIAAHGLAASVLHQVWEDPLGMALRVTHEFGHFWELYPTRLATDDRAHREELHREDPRLPVTPSFPRRIRDWVSALSFGGELSLALVGIGVTWRRSRAATGLLLAVTLTYALGYALFIAKLRYRIAVLPCVLLFAGAGATTLAAAFRARRRPQPSA